MSKSTPTPAPVEEAEDASGTATDRASRTRSPFIALAALICYIALPVTGVLASGTGFLVAVIASQLTDVAVLTDEFVRSGLARGQLGIATRTLLRELSAVALVLAAGDPTSWTTRAQALLLLAVAGSRLTYMMAMVPIRRRMNLPVTSRNIDVSGLRIPRTPPAWMTTRLSERFHGVSMVALMGAAIAVLADASWVIYATAGLVVLAQLIGTGALARLFLTSRGFSAEALLAAVNRRVLAMKPEVVLYHSGEPETAYQVNMWLSTVDALSRTVLVVMRERACYALLGKTTSPVVCIPGSVDFMTFPLPDVRVALYTANVGKTIHLLREPGIRHVFVGHGDSDKTASSNPFSKVYSEIWVAGDAGRDRYRRTDVGIRDEEIVNVGRPQLRGISVAAEVPRDRDLTVLYAPTWEGWVNDPAHTSVLRTGPALVQRLVALPGVRLVYKPHPLTGSVSVAAGRADAAIRATIASSRAREHKVAAGDLYDCFNNADVLIADISSVLSDFIASQKPYVVTNLTSMPEDEFREMFPSAGAAYLLDPAATRIDSILDEIRSNDPMASRRRELKVYLLGPDEPDALTRFGAAVDAAYDRAVASCPIRPILTVSTV